MKIDHRQPKRAPRPVYAPRPLNVISGQKGLNADMKRYQAPGATRGTQSYGQLIADEFSYSTSVFTLTGTNGATVSLLIKLDNDSFFEIAKRQIFASSVNFPKDHPLLITIRDVASGLYLCDASAGSSLFGDGGLPAELPQIKKLSPSQMIAVDVVQLAPTHPDNAVTGQITFTGRKVFTRGY